MRSNRYFFIIVLCLLVTALGWSGVLAQKTTEGTLSDSTLAEDLSSDIAVEWMQLIYDRAREDAISAPAASRLYGYAGVTLYESILPGMPNNFTLFGQVNGFPTVPYPAQEDGVFDWISVANGALSTVMTGLFEQYSEDSVQAFADLRALWADRRTGDVTPDVIERSLAYGDEVGEVILTWAMSDGIDEMDRPFEPRVGPEYWVPTAAEQQSIAPYWGELRTFTLSYAQECDVYVDYEFSTDPESPFYAQAMEVYEVGQNLTEEQMEIARYWVDTPAMTGTPAGHWVLIQNELTDVLEMSLNRAAEMYVKTNAALADSFIATWALKYLYPLLRPETYINEYIDPRWSPYIASPNFPEYPSGHSTSSAAAAQVLQSMFGQVAFTSVTFPGGVRMQREFTSFRAAASEAAISRLYGGIHFRAAIENGMEMGECIGAAAFNRITLRSLPQGE
jgi:membrane-associated phospholipid phosphatase